VAVEHEARTVGLGGGADVGQVVAALRFAIGKGEGGIAADDPGITSAAIAPPTAVSAPPPITTVCSQGSIAMTLPSSSIMIAFSRWPPPMPPYSSAKGAQVSPSSLDSAFQMPGSRPSGRSSIFLRVSKS
jgi:hypothetical protein